MHTSNSLHFRMLLYMANLTFTVSTQVLVTLLTAMDKTVTKTLRALALANFNLWFDTPRSSNRSLRLNARTVLTTFEFVPSTPSLEYSRFWGKLAWFFLSKRKFLVLSTYQWENSVVVQTVLHIAGALPGKGLQTLCWHNRILIGLRRKRYIRWGWETQLLIQYVGRWMQEDIKYMQQ